MWQVIYGNYFPREVESTWETKEEAEARCEVLEKEQDAAGLGLGMWVTEEVYVSEKPKGIAVLINGDEQTSINMADLAVGDPIVDVDSRPKMGFTGIEYIFDEAVPPNTFMVIDKPAAITPEGSVLTSPRLKIYRELDAAVIAIPSHYPQVDALETGVLHHLRVAYIESTARGVAYLEAIDTQLDNREKS